MFSYLSIILYFIQICILYGVEDNVLDPDYFDKVEIKGDIIVPISGRNSKINAKSWEGGIVPYLFEASTDEDFKKDIEAAMESYSTETNSCITFVPRKDEKAYILFVGATTSCASSVGRLGIKQGTFFGPGCRRRSILIHELFHVLGFVHEHSRTDRDEYVTIKFENILEDRIGNFDIDNDTDNLGVPYDYESIVHYKKNDFSRNGQPTILTVDPAFQDIIGNAEGLSDKDKLKIELRYNCSTV